MSRVRRRLLTDEHERRCVSFESKILAKKNKTNMSDTDSQKPGPIFGRVSDMLPRWVLDRLKLLVKVFFCFFLEWTKKEQDKNRKLFGYFFQVKGEKYWTSSPSPFGTWLSVKLRKTSVSRRCLVFSLRPSGEFSGQSHSEGFGRLCLARVEVCQRTWSFWQTLRKFSGKG